MCRPWGALTGQDHQKCPSLCPSVYSTCSITRDQWAKGHKRKVGQTGRSCQQPSDQQHFPQRSICLGEALHPSFNKHRLRHLWYPGPTWEPRRPHSATLLPKARGGSSILSIFRNLVTHSQSPSTSAPTPAPDNSNFQSLHMCLCACVSVFYLHYPCLLLATETKYFKAEKASQPTGLLLPVLLPARERGWWRILQAPIYHVCLQLLEWEELARCQLTPSWPLLCGAPAISPPSSSLEARPWKPRSLTCLDAEYIWTQSFKSQNLGDPLSSFVH